MDIDDGRGQVEALAAWHGTGAGTRGVGRLGEDLAAALLVGRGLRLLERNWRCRDGEIDLVLRDDASGTVVFCEVKCRRGRGYGDPLEAITFAKVTKLRALAALWCREQSQPQTHVRLDAVGVLLEPGRAPQFTHLEAIG